MRYLVIGMVLALLLPATAGAADCETRGSTTLVETRFAVVFQKLKPYRGDRVPVVYGCVKSVGRFSRLGRRQIVPTDARFGLQGRFAAHLLEGSTGSELLVRDLRRRVTVFRVPLPSSSTAPAAVRAVQVKRDGTVAWIEDRRQGAPLADTRAVMLGRPGEDEHSVLDQASVPAMSAEQNPIDPLSLASDPGNRLLYWLHSGVARSAPFG